MKKGHEPVYERPLTKSQRAFADYVIEHGAEHGSLVRAYRHAYNVTGTDKSAHESASRLLKHVKIRSRINNALEAAEVTPSFVLAGLRNRATESENDVAAVKAYEHLARILRMFPESSGAAVNVNAENAQLNIGSDALDKLAAGFERRGLVQGVPSVNDDEAQA